MLAAMVLGAEGVQAGTRFVASEEASSHISFKEAVAKAAEGDTQLSLKKLTPVRLLKNRFYQEVTEAERRGAGVDELKEILGRLPDERYLQQLLVLQRAFVRGILAGSVK